MPGTASGQTRAADGISAGRLAGRAVVVPLAEEIFAIGRRPVAVRVGVLIVRIHLDVHPTLMLGA